MDPQNIVISSIERMRLRKARRIPIAIKAETVKKAARITVAIGQILALGCALQNRNRAQNGIISTCTVAKSAPA